MKEIILDNKITSITATSENTNFTASNLLDEHPKRQWKAASGVTTATLTCEVASSTSGLDGSIALIGTNATSVICNITDPNQFDWIGGEWVDITWGKYSPLVTIEVDSSGSANAIWAKYNNTDAALNIDFILEAEEELYGGVLMIGPVTEVKNPMYGVDEGLVDYSNEGEYLNGAYYYDKKDIVSTYNGVMRVDREDEFYTFMRGYAKTYGKQPKAMRITDADNFNWVVYARLRGMPSGGHDMPDYSTINYQLIEVL